MSLLPFRQLLLDTKLATRSRRTQANPLALADVYQGRLMIPIHDPKGNVIGFGARSIPDVTPSPWAGDGYRGDGAAAKAPKYLNSPEVSLSHSHGTGGHGAGC